MKQLLLLLALALSASALSAEVGAESSPSPQVEPAFATSGAFIALSVPNLEESVHWYEEKFGLRVSMRPPPHEQVSVAILEGGGLIVELIHNPKAIALRDAVPSITNPGMVHGMFKAGLIVENYDKTLAALRERGVSIVMGPFPPRDGQRANFIIKDNAGNLLQFFGK